MINLGCLISHDKDNTNKRILLDYCCEHNLKCCEKNKWIPFIDKMSAIASPKSFQERYHGLSICLPSISLWLQRLPPERVPTTETLLLQLPVQLD